MKQYCVALHWTPQEAYMQLVEQQCRAQHAKTHDFLPMKSPGCSQAGAWIAGSGEERHRAGAPTSFREGEVCSCGKHSLKGEGLFSSDPHGWSEGTVNCEYMTESIRLLEIHYRRYLKRCLLIFLHV